jgi:hypothetical protein
VCVTVHFVRFIVSVACVYSFSSARRRLAFGSLDGEFLPLPLVMLSSSSDCKSNGFDA